MTAAPTAIHSARRRVGAAALAVAALLVTALSPVPTAGAAPDATSAPVAHTRDGRATTITIRRADRVRAVSGQKVSFVGSVPKRLAGTRVVLQRRDGTKAPWVTVHRNRVRSDGSFRLSGRAGGAGRSSWRATSTREVQGRKTVTTSPTIAVTVYSWFFLTDVAEPVDESAESGSYPFTGNLTAGGRSFPRSVTFGSYTTAWDWELPSWMEYNLSYRCVELRANLGVADSSESGTNATFYVSLDGARSAVGTMGLGPSSVISADVSGVLRLRLEGVPNSRDLYGRGGFGDIQVLCHTSP